MLHENAKQVVIIRDINSNIIEEAIFVLKNNADVVKDKKKGQEAVINSRNSDYVIKEAQNIINNYIKQYSAGYGYITSVPKAAKPKKWNISTGVVLNTALVVSITLFLFLLSRAF